MSMRKMRLVSETLYNKIMSMDPDPTERLVKEKEEILESKVIPEEMKPQLYHQAVRKIAQKMKEADETPILTTSSTPSIPTDKLQKRQLLETFLEVNGVTKDINGKLVIDGKAVDPTYEQLLKRLLGKDKTKTNFTGLTKVHARMKQAGIPQTFFYEKPEQMGAGLKPPKKARISGSKSASTKRHVRWTPY